MKLKYLLILVLFIALKTYSQDSSNVLFKIDNEPYYSSEFLAVYKKNLNIVSDTEDNTIEKYLQMFVDYKLKVKSAKAIGLDTVKSYKSELEQYKKALVLPYLKDENVTNKLVKEAYDRLIKEVNVSHILIFLKPEATPADTLAAYNELLAARKLIIEGSPFSDIAKKYSKDPSVKENGGEIGYFTALQMVYPFENMAYATPLGEVSMPFRTKFGFHILKVNDIRNSEGEVEVAHIMLKNNTDATAKKMDSIYKLIESNPSDFEKLAKNLSEDNASAPNGGRLKKFNSGQMINAFSDVAFSLQTIGEISKPFHTPYGWHIIKLINKYPIEDFEALESKLLSQVENDDRSNLIGKSVIERLFKEYNIVVSKDALNQFNEGDWKNSPENFQQILIKIQEKDIYQNKFIQFLNKGNNQSISAAFKVFKETEVLNYYKENIEFNNAEFAATYKEFEEGLLLFEMLEKQVWEKSKDSIGLINYFESNKSTQYVGKDLNNNKGQIISDYQNYLEKMWVKELHQKYKVEFIENEKKHILKTKFN
ncbi:MAG: peptidylprolyl isomerase [Bacteroidetes bacterium]|nr:peptidylprolyl isomerase [Bacteroidota bacterium]